jgi:hypothetical protein
VRLMVLSYGWIWMTWKWESPPSEARSTSRPTDSRGTISSSTLPKLIKIHLKSPQWNRSRRHQ